MENELFMKKVKPGVEKYLIFWFLKDKEKGKKRPKDGELLVNEGDIEPDRLGEYIWKQVLNKYNLADFTWVEVIITPPGGRANMGKFLANAVTYYENKIRSYVLDKRSEKLESFKPNLFPLEKPV